MEGRADGNGRLPGSWKRTVLTVGQVGRGDVGPRRNGSNESVLEDSGLVTLGELGLRMASSMLLASEGPKESVIESLLTLEHELKCSSPAWRTI